MKKKITKRMIMNHYYSDEELKDSMKLSAKGAMKWLEEANRFFKKATPKATKKLQLKLIKEGW